MSHPSSSRRFILFLALSRSEHHGFYRNICHYLNRTPFVRPTETTSLPTRKKEKPISDRDHESTYCKLYEGKGFVWLALWGKTRLFWDIIHLPISSGVNEWASEWMSAVECASEATSAEQVDQWARCEWTSERSSEWPSTVVTSWFLAVLPHCGLVWLSFVSYSKGRDHQQPLVLMIGNFARHE